MPFETNVFINCPFDDDFKVLLKPLVFCIIYFDLEPQLSQTQSSANIRINQIKKLIRESKYSIHDLSRSRPMTHNDLPRFNMPYELGLDAGCIEFGSKKHREKKILILEADPFYYQRVLSDIAGQDVESHENDPAAIVRKVRNWFSTIDPERNYPSGNKVWLAYNKFAEDNAKQLLASGFTNQEIRQMPAGDFIKFAKDWLKNFT